MTNEKKIELYYDHYKDTFNNLKGYIQRRNYFTILLLLLIATLSFQITNPEKSLEITNILIKKNVGNITIDFDYITSILLFTVLWIVIMYFQLNFLIEKHYNYIHEIETKLTENLKPFNILREGVNYLDHYPWLSFVVHRIYTILFPLVLILVVITKWFMEKKSLNGVCCDWHFWIDTVFIFGIVLASMLYLSNRHFNDFRKRKTIKPSS